MIKVKICGTTNLEDALTAIRCGADALGFIFWNRSPRCVDAKTAHRIIGDLPPFITTVGVFVNEAADVVNTIVKDCRLDRVQLHGDETPEYCDKIHAKTIKVFRVKEAEDIKAIRDYNNVSTYLLDAYLEGLPGGTGRVFNWDLAVDAKKFGPIILSGGLTPENVKEAVLKVRPYGVDVCSGVELKPGKKDPEKVLRFVKEVRGFQ